MENVPVNAANNTHLQYGLVSIALRKPNALSQNFTWMVNYVLQKFDLWVSLLIGYISGTNQIHSLWSNS